jgi:Predicted Fe-S oxidoreductases
VSFKKLYIELTDKCNLNCKMCYRRSWAEKPKDMEKKVLYKIHSEVVNKKLNEIVLGGIGEPTYSPLIYDAISLFSSFNLTITTNGTLLDDKLKSLIVDNVNKIVVSIDGLEDKYKDN